METSFLLCDQGLWLKWEYAVCHLEDVCLKPIEWAHFPVWSKLPSKNPKNKEENLPSCNVVLQSAVWMSGTPSFLKRHTQCYTNCSLYTGTNFLTKLKGPLKCIHGSHFLSVVLLVFEFGGGNPVFGGATNSCWEISRVCGEADWIK